jgi:hypothetical protein
VSLGILTSFLEPSRNIGQDAFSHICLDTSLFSSDEDTIKKTIQ